MMLSHRRSEASQTIPSRSLRALVLSRMTWQNLGLLGVTFWAFLVLTIPVEPVMQSTTDTLVDQGLTWLLVIVTLFVVRSPLMLDAVLWLGAAILVCSLLLARQIGALPASVYGILAILLWVAAIVESLPRWSITPVNRFASWKRGDLMLQTVIVAAAMSLLIETVLQQTQPLPMSTRLWPIGFVLITIGCWQSVSHVVFARSLLGLCLLGQGVVMISSSLHRDSTASTITVLTLCAVIFALLCRQVYLKTFAKTPDNKEIDATRHARQLEIINQLGHLP